MKRFITILRKDLKQSREVVGPSFLLCLPLLVLFSLGMDGETHKEMASRVIFWICLFISLISLFYRSFSGENRYGNFHIYTSLRVKASLVFWSQTLLHFLFAFALGIFYWFLSRLLTGLEADTPYLLLGFVALALAPLGSLLGLMLQMEREFLFSLIFLPLSTPVFLAALSYETTALNSWLYVLGIYATLSLYLSAFLFEFFFDELTQSL